MKACQPLMQRLSPRAGFVHVKAVHDRGDPSFEGYGTVSTLAIDIVATPGVFGFDARTGDTAHADHTQESCCSPAEICILERAFAVTLGAGDLSQGWNSESSQPIVVLKTGVHR